MVDDLAAKSRKLSFQCTGSAEGKFGISVESSYDSSNKPRMTNKASITWTSATSNVTETLVPSFWFMNLRKFTSGTIELVANNVFNETVTHRFTVDGQTNQITEEVSATTQVARGPDTLLEACTAPETVTDDQGVYYITTCRDAIVQYEYVTSSSSSTQAPRGAEPSGGPKANSSRKFKTASNNKDTNTSFSNIQSNVLNLVWSSLRKVSRFAEWTTPIWESLGNYLFLWRDLANAEQKLLARSPESLLSFSRLTSNTNTDIFGGLQPEVIASLPELGRYSALLASDGEPDTLTHYVATSWRMTDMFDPVGESPSWWRVGLRETPSLLTRYVANLGWAPVMVYANQQVLEFVKSDTVVKAATKLDVTDTQRGVYAMHMVLALGAFLVSTLVLDWIKNGNRIGKSVYVGVVLYSLMFYIM